MAKDSSDKKKNIKNKIKIIIDELDKKCGKIGELGGDTAKADDIILKARESLEKDQLPKAKSLALKTKAILVEIKKDLLKKRKARKKPPKPPAKKKEPAREEKEPLKDTDSETGEEDVEEGKEIVETDEKAAEEVKGEEDAKDEFMEKAQELLIKTQGLLDELQGKIDLDTETELFNNGIGIFREGKHKEAFELYTGLLENLHTKREELSQAQAKAKELIIALQKELSVLEDRGVDIGETWDIYQGLVENYTQGNYMAVPELAEQISQQVDLWKNYDDSLVKLLNLRLILSELKSKGGDIGELYERFSKIQDQLHKQDYASAQESSASIAEDTRIQIRELMKKPAMELLKEAEDILQLAEESGENTSEYSEAIEKSNNKTEAGEYEASITISKDILNKLQPIYLKKLATELQELMEEADRRELDVEEHKARFIQCQGLMEEARLSEAVEILLESNKKIRYTIEYDKCIVDIRDIRDQLQGLAQAGFDIESAQKELMPAKDEMENGNFTEVHEIISRVRENIRRINSSGDLKVLLDGIWKDINQLRDVGMEVSEYNDALYDIEQKIFHGGSREDESEDFQAQVENARSTLETMKGEVDRLIEAYPASIELIQTSQYNISKMEEYGGHKEELSDRFEKLTEAFSGRHLEEAVSIGKELVGLSERLLKNYIHAVMNMDELKDLCRKIEGYGGDPAEIISMQEEAAEILGDGDYDEALEKTEDAINNAKELKKDLQLVIGKKQVLWSKMALARKLGINTKDKEEKYQGLDDILETLGPRRTLDTIAEIMEELENLTGHYKTSAEYIQEAQENIFSLKEKGLLMKDHQEKFRSLIPLLDENDYKGATELAKEIVRETKLIKQKHSLLLRSINTAQAKIAKAKRKGTDISSVLDDFKEAGKLMDIGELKDAQDLIDDVIKEVENNTTLHEEAAQLLRMTWERLSEVKALGIESRDIEEKVEKTKNFIRDGDYQNSIDISKELGEDIVVIIGNRDQ